MTDEEVFEIVRFAVPATWSDWSVARVVRRLVPHEDDDPPPTMPRGLTHEERRTHHATTRLAPARQAT